MAKTYYLRFGAGDPRTYTGLAPTMLFFAAAGTTVAPPAISEALPGSGVYTFSYGTTTSISFLADAATTSPGPQGRYVVGSIDPADRSDEYGTTLTAIGSTLTAIGTTNFALGTTNVALGTTSVALGVAGNALGTANLVLGTSITAQGVSITAQGVTILAGITLLASSGITVTVAVGGIGSTASSFGDSSTDPADLFGYMKRIVENLEGNQTFLKASGALTQYSRGSSVALYSKAIANSVSTVIKS